MFRESSAIDSERTASGVRALYAKYSENEEWFTGTPDSVDRRIAQCKRISNAAKAASVRLAGRNAGGQYIALAQEMDSDRTALEGLRRDLLTASSDRMAADVAPTQPTPPVNDGSGPPMESPLVPPTPAPAPQPTVMASLRPEARLFIAEQECDDLGELLIRAQHHAERVSSTLPARQSRTHVASFVEAVRHAAITDPDPADQEGVGDMNWDYIRRHTPTKEDVARQQREDRDRRYQEWIDSGAPHHGSRTASLDDFPADLMYLE
jgi:hypothetical protein